ncbi:hypothetical protein TVAG_417160 [Trichomonas vaginalis G3]|uniref:Uncharacterized protein n=1 Tax=Trichomonas vaginalis (strain ATCC PRA-98 / G3) TaxID=412133 RepID=A2ESH4_TRIV3|nr:MIP11318P family [Trichomonas vaginalis G3]EAY04418.1 hypothetical protein TVAG_417160 [Trichomonas vaginalis G3]KAI5526325.1 MIP11318P family [Trichomonas vaginalis G3]|eukprot:XP_001316641.1 hypothetical protein [Trichomonas vaginalis G3]
MYRAPPEVSRICVRKARDRAYQKHLNALKNVKPSIDTRQPITPNSIGKNFKRYEIEKQHNLAIQNQNVRLVHRLDKILREEHYCAQPPGRPHTLQGRFQKEQMLRITEENAKIVKAIQQSRPLLNRNDWYMHRLDHEYQLHKNAEYKQTLPMSEIIQIDEQEQSARRQSYKKDDDFANIYPPKPPSTARPEYRPSRNSVQNEEQYEVHEPPPRPTTDDKRYDVEDSENQLSLHNQIEDHLKDDFGPEKQQNDDQDFSLSIKHEIEEEAIKVDDSLDIQNENETKDTNMSLSIKGELKDNINEENLEANGKDDTKDESLSIKPQIQDQNLEANGVDDTPEANHEENNNSEPKDQNVGGLSIKPSLDNDKLEANGVDDTKDESFSLKLPINSGNLEANGVDDTPEEPKQDQKPSELQLGEKALSGAVDNLNKEEEQKEDSPKLGLAGLVNSTVNDGLEEKKEAENAPVPSLSDALLH